MSEVKEGRRDGLPLNAVIGWLIVLVIVYAALYAAVSYVAFVSNPDSATLKGVQSELHNIGMEGWKLVSPLLQLAIVLAIVAWARQRLEFKWDLAKFQTEHNVKAFIAIIVVVGFVVAVMGSLEYTSYLKDVALVIVGFYFGSAGLKQPSMTATAPAPRADDSTGSG